MREGVSPSRHVKMCRDVNYSHCFPSVRGCPQTYSYTTNSVVVASNRAGVSPSSHTTIVQGCPLVVIGQTSYEADDLIAIYLFNLVNSMLINRQKIGPTNLNSKQLFVPQQIMCVMKTVMVGY